MWKELGIEVYRLKSLAVEVDLERFGAFITLYEDLYRIGFSTNKECVLSKLVS